MEHYHVDLRSYSVAERESLYELLDGFSHFCNPFFDLEHRGIYDVFWDSSESIANLLKIPEKLIIPQF